MHFIIKGATILDPNSEHHLQVMDIEIVNGIIKKIAHSIDSSSANLINASNHYLSIGWFDMRTTIGEPGFEHKEDIESICAAAAKGGFTEIASLPNTKPVVQSKNVVSFIASKSEQYLVQIHPMAAVTNNREGKEITEMMDLHFAGAVAFTDADLPIWHADVMLKTLQYLKPIDGLLISHAEDHHISHFGQMNESIESTMLGLKGIPKIAEELMVERDISILKYTGGKIHFAHISSPHSLNLIAQAKQNGLNITCDVAAYQMVLDDTLIKTFDTNLKVNPPLRSKEDISAIIQHLLSGTIDCIVSDHIPQDVESKNLEYDLADFGMIGLETLFPLFNQILPKEQDFKTLLDKIAYNPRKILKTKIPVIKENEIANLTLFDADKEWIYEEKNILSKSKNSPFIGAKLKGSVKAVFSKNKHIVHY
jgi:dihydroorotase